MGMLCAVNKSVTDEDSLMEVALEAGAEDVRDAGDVFEVITEPDDYEAVKAAIDEAGLETEDASVTKLPQNTVEVTGKEAEQMVRLLQTLEDCDDVQNVYTSADIPDEAVDAA